MSYKTKSTYRPAAPDRSTVVAVPPGWLDAVATLPDDDVPTRPGGPADLIARRLIELADQHATMED